MFIGKQDIKLTDRKKGEIPDNEVKEIRSRAESDSATNGGELKTRATWTPFALNAFLYMARDRKFLHD